MIMRILKLVCPFVHFCLSFCSLNIGKHSVWEVMGLVSFSAKNVSQLKTLTVVATVGEMPWPKTLLA